MTHPAPPNPWTMDILYIYDKTWLKLKSNTSTSLWSGKYSPGTNLQPVEIIDYRCDNRRFWLFTHNCQVPTPTSQNLELEQRIRIFRAD